MLLCFVLFSSHIYRVSPKNGNITHNCNGIPVTSHEYQSVDGDISCHIDDILNSSAPGQTKWPVHQNVVTGSSGDTHQDEQQVSHRQVQYQQVGGVLQLGIPTYLQ